MANLVKETLETNSIFRNATHPPGGAGDEDPHFLRALISWPISRISGVVIRTLHAEGRGGVIEEKSDKFPTWVTGLGI